MKPLLALALPVMLSANAAAAAGYSGNWLVTVSHATRSDGTYCLTLTDDGSFGWPHSGLASLTSQAGGNLPYGTFQVINHTLVATFQQQGGEGQNAGLVFTAPAKSGDVGKGVYEQVYGGEESDSGVAAFGTKGSC